MSTLTYLELLAGPGLAWAAWLSFRRGDRWAGLFTAALAGAVLYLLSVVLLIFGVLVVSGVVYFRWNRSADTVRRWGRRARRKHGVASTFDIVRRTWLSRHGIRAKASVVRPSLGELSRWARLRTPLTEFAIEMCRSGWLRVWSSIEDVILVLGGPRRGKSGWAAARVLKAPGACVVTSTRTDLHDRTAHIRGKTGPTYVFNAAGVGGRPSTITFDVLTDCADPTAAMERASDLLMLSSDQDGEGSRWDRQSRRVLGAFLHAAALGGRPSSAVLKWVARPDDSKREVTSLLRRSPVPEFVEDAMQFLETNDRTRSSITSGIMPALAWLMAPASAAAAAPSDSPFDVRRLLRERGTVYMLGAEEAHTAPLLAALTGYIARQARRIAAEQPEGRLDPSLTFVLDEIVLSAPIPLPKWVADMGGAGITIIALAQSLSQIDQRWGEDGTRTILDNAGSIMLFGGTKDPRSLSVWATLLGQRDEDVASKDAGGRVTGYSQRPAPVISAAQLSNLPAFRVLLLQTGLPPLVGRARMVWQLPEFKSAKRAMAAAARAAVAEAEAVAQGAPVGAAPVEESPGAAVAQLPAPRTWAVGSDGSAVSVAQSDPVGRRWSWARVRAMVGGGR